LADAGHAKADGAGAGSTHEGDGFLDLSAFFFGQIVKVGLHAVDQAADPREGIASALAQASIVASSRSRLRSRSS
jgi:hypothetical protein